MQTVKKILYTLGLIIQLALCIGVFILEELTNKRAGIMHHVYYMRAQYEQGIFFNLAFHKLILISLALIMTWKLIQGLSKKAEKFKLIQLGIGAMLSLVTIFIVYEVSAKLSYYYFIMAFEIALGIQLLTIMGAGIKRKKYKKLNGQDSM